jgi:hypothetical protein
LHENLQVKCRRPRPGTKLCASLRSRNAFRDFTRATSYGNWQAKCHGPKPRPTVCASVRSRNACQHFTRGTFYRNLPKKTRAQSEHPDQASAFTLTVRTPHCGHTLWGKTGFCRYLEMSELCNVFPLFQPPHRRFTRTQVIAMKAD